MIVITTRFFLMTDAANRRHLDSELFSENVPAMTFSLVLLRAFNLIRIGLNWNLAGRRFPARRGDGSMSSNVDSVDLIASFHLSALKCRDLVARTPPKIDTDNRISNSSHGKSTTT